MSPSHEALVEIPRPDVQSAKMHSRADASPARGKALTADVTLFQGTIQRSAALSRVNHSRVGCDSTANPQQPAAFDHESR
jgi:hypothetical protein